MLPNAAAQAEAPALSLPLACEPGRDCWIANYVDVDPTDAARDYACGRMSYNAHSGIDFALRDLKAMQDGVPVLAAADGIVLGTRDGEPDMSIRERGRDAVKGRECGNAVRIAHAGNWTTQYCHMRRGSVAVRRGDTVSAGQKLGLVGLSGETEFPHVHLTVREGSRVVDPFQGADAPKACGLGASPLWKAATLAALPYRRGALYNFGVAAEAPDAEKARRGDYRARTLSASAPLIAIWAEAFGTVPGDAIRIELTGPDGRLLIGGKDKVERTQARTFRWAARSSAGAAWAAGTYHGKIAYLGREEPPQVLSTAEFDVEVR